MCRRSEWREIGSPEKARNVVGESVEIADYARILVDRRRSLGEDHTRMISKTNFCWS